MSLFDRAVVTLLPAVPKRVVRTLSSRYIAGSELDDARRVVAELNAGGKLATVDVLGEEVSDETEAAAIAVRVRCGARRLRAGRPRRERQHQADRARPEARLRALQEKRRGGDRGGGADEPLRADRHGGLVHDRRDPTALPRAARRGPWAGRSGPPGVAQANGRGRGLTRRGERPALQGDLHRARVDPVPRRPGREGQLRRRHSRRSWTAIATRRSRRTTSGSSSRRSASCANGASSTIATSSRCCWA